MTENNTRNMYKGFSLFNDIEDYALRVRNRAVVLSNLFQDNSKDSLVSPKGAALIMGYFSAIASDERGDVKNKFSETMIERGYKLQA